MKIIYTGNLESVELLDTSTGKVYPCKRNEPTEVPDALGREQLRTVKVREGDNEKEVPALADWKLESETKE